MIKAETVTVYHGGGRRWLTLKTAAKREAMATVRERHRCECDGPEYDGGHMIYPGYNCNNHPGDARFDKMVRRLASLHIAAYRATPQNKE